MRARDPRPWGKAVRLGLVVAGAMAFGSVCGSNRPVVHRAITRVREVRERFERTPRPAPGIPATFEEAGEFATAVDAAVSAHGSLRSLLDGDVFVDRALGDLQLPIRMTRPAVDGVAEKLQHSLKELLKEGGSYRCLDNRIVNGERRVKFRLLQAGGGFNYHDYVVVKRAGSIRAVDVHLLLMAEPMSLSVRRAVLPFAIDANKALLARLSPAENEYYHNLATIEKVAGKQGDPRGALAAYRQLPDDLKRDRNLLTMRLRAASLLVDDDAEYLSAMDDYRRAFPDESSTEIVSIDYFLKKQRYAEALDAITALEESAGPDPHLNVLRATALMHLSLPELARAEIKTALEREPELAEAASLDILLDLSLGLDGVARSKVEDARRRNVDLSSVQNNPAFAAFMATFAAFMATPDGSAPRMEKPSETTDRVQPAARSP